MKYVVLFMFLLWTAISDAQPENSHWNGQQLELGKTYYTFADNLTLRAKPDANGDKIALLPVNTAVTIEAISKSVITVNGIALPWVQVTANGKKGYLASGLISLARLPFNNDSHLLYIRVNSNTRDEYAQQISFRLAGNNTYRELGTFDLQNLSFAVNVYDNRGLTGIDHVIQVDYLAESCGEEGGLSYFTFSTKTGDFNSLGYFSSVGDADVYHKFEELIFPSDEHGMLDTIRYQGEEGSYSDKDETEYRTVQKAKDYQWSNGKLVKPIVKFVYD